MLPARINVVIDINGTDEREVEQLIDYAAHLLQRVAGVKGGGRIRLV